jgi:hypothetical protein
MQFMPATWAEWSARGESPFDPAASARAAARYLNWLLSQFQGDLGAALAAYNWGIGNVRRTSWPLPSWLDELPEETVDYALRIVDWLAAVGYRHGTPARTDSSRDVVMSFQRQVGLLPLAGLVVLIAAMLASSSRE